MDTVVDKCRDDWTPGEIKSVLDILGYMSYCEAASYIFAGSRYHGHNLQNVSLV